MAGQISFMKSAIKNRITSNVILAGMGNPKAAACELVDNGRPTVPYQGLAFFGIHSGKRRVVNGGPGTYYIDEYYDFKVTITLKSANAPRYRFGDKVIDDSVDGAIQYLADLVITSLSGYLSLSEEANTLLLAAFPSHQTFINGEPAMYQGSGDPIEQYGDWFGASLDRKAASAITSTSSPMGVSLELRFNGLHMIRPIGQS